MMDIIGYSEWNALDMDKKHKRFARSVVHLDEQLILDQLTREVGGGGLSYINHVDDKLIKASW
jgi:hypothetical protein